MRFDASFTPFATGRFSDLQQWAASFTTALQRLLAILGTLLNGQISFGDGSSTDNIKGEWNSFTSHASGGTETAIPHTLGVIPTGFLLTTPPTSGTVNKGTTPWTSTHIYLTFSASAQAATIFILGPPATE